VLQQLFTNYYTLPRESWQIEGVTLRAYTKIKCDLLHIISCQILYVGRGTETAEVTLAQQQRAALGTIFDLFSQIKKQNIERHCMGAFILLVCTAASGACDAKTEGEKGARIALSLLTGILGAFTLGILYSIYRAYKKTNELFSEINMQFAGIPCYGYHLPALTALDMKASPEETRPSLIDTRYSEMTRFIAGNLEGLPEPPSCIICLETSEKKQEAAEESGTSAYVPLLGTSEDTSKNEPLYVAWTQGNQTDNQDSKDTAIVLGSLFHEDCFKRYLTHNALGKQNIDPKNKKKYILDPDSKQIPLFSVQKTMDQYAVLLQKLGFAFQPRPRTTGPQITVLKSRAQGMK
jgi:hypothetical protein